MGSGSKYSDWSAPVTDGGWVGTRALYSCGASLRTGGHIGAAFSLRLVSSPRLCAIRTALRAESVTASAHTIVREDLDSGSPGRQQREARKGR